MNIEKAIENVDRIIASEAGRPGGILRRLGDGSALGGGKRLRARAFFIFAGKADAGSVRSAAAIELLHAATLVHDDIMDSSETRRGRPSLHALHGVKTGLLYGDYLFSSAFSLAARSSDPKIFGWMTRAVRETLEGEILQNYRRGDCRLTREEYLSFIEKKSGALFGLACGLGAYKRGLDAETVERSRVCGAALGAAYQLADDYLDYFSGGPAGEKYGDIREGVATLPLLYFLEICSPAEREEAEKLLKGSGLPGGADETVRLMEDYGVPGKVRRDIEDLHADGMSKTPGYARSAVAAHFSFHSWLGERKEKLCLKNA